MGNIKARVGHLRKLIDALVLKTNGDISPAGLTELAEKIEGVGSNYIHKKIFLPISKKKDSENLSLRESNLNPLAIFLGHKNFADFVNTLSKPVDPQLRSMVGTYYNYVRKNLKDTSLFKAPVQISETKTGFLFELKGASELYRGEPYLSNGCIFITMKSPKGKIFHHLYKIGNKHTPLVLQGVFAGVSSSFEPIGGRTVLARTDDDFKKAVNTSLTSAELKKSKNPHDNIIESYFKEYKNNNVSTLKSYAYDWEDLEQE